MGAQVWCAQCGPKGLLLIPKASLVHQATARRFVVLKKRQLLFLSEACCDTWLSQQNLVSRPPL